MGLGSRAWGVGWQGGGAKDGQRARRLEVGAPRYLNPTP